MSTPKILWQTWKSKTDIPKRLAKFNQMWRDTHPDYEWILLDDDDLRDMVEKITPQYLEAYDGFEHFIERVDFARYAILYCYGGVYSDMDVKPLKRIDRFVESNKIVLGSEPKEHTLLLYGRKSVPCNAFMISPPGEPFWLEFMEYIVKNYNHKSGRPVWNTGPMALTKFIEERGDEFKDRLEVFDACYFYPLTGAGTVTIGCDMKKDSYVAHVWQNSWVDKSLTASPRFRECWFWLFFLTFIVVWVYCFLKR